jgi:hypothetical protein
MKQYPIAATCLALLAGPLLAEDTILWVYDRDRVTSEDPKGLMAVFQEATNSYAIFESGTDTPCHIENMAVDLSPVSPSTVPVPLYGVVNCNSLAGQAGELAQLSAKLDGFQPVFAPDLTTSIYQKRGVPLGFESTPFILRGASGTNGLLRREFEAANGTKFGSYFDFTTTPPEDFTFQTIRPIVIGGDSGLNDLPHTNGTAFITRPNTQVGETEGGATMSLCRSNVATLSESCFFSAVGIGERGTNDALMAVGSAVLIDEQTGTYLTAGHVGQEYSGYFTSSDGDGYISAGYDTLTNGYVQQLRSIKGVRNSFHMHFAPAQNLEGVPENQIVDLLLFQTGEPHPDYAESYEPLGEVEFLEQHKILSAGTTVGEGTPIISAGFGIGSRPDDSAGGIRRYSLMRTAQPCRVQTDGCTSMMNRVAIPFASTSDNEACKADSGSPIYAEVLDAGNAPTIAVIGILIGRTKGPAVDCKAEIQYLDLTHPDIQHWIAAKIAELNQETITEVRDRIFTQSVTVNIPDLAALLVH